MQDFSNQYLKQFEKSTEELLKMLTSFSQENFNTIPREGGWSAGQVAQHLLKGEAGLPRLFDGNNRPANRPVDEKVNTIRSIFMDFENKMKSPDFILPTDDPKNLKEMIQAFKDSREAIRKKISAVDMSKSFPDFPFPGLGEFTGWEWIFFVTCHTMRHTHQLKKIFDSINANE
jgi:uncharacterized damage-inducible protein DinB